MQKTRLKIVLSLLLVMVLTVCSAAVIVPSIVPSTVAQAAGNAWDYTGTYYDNLNENLEGSAFRSQLAQLITETHNTGANSYSKLTSQFNITDANPETGKGMLFFYTGTQVSSYGDSSANREHVWPKDGGRAFPEKSGPGCDLQHLRPTDTNLNSTRGSKSFDELPTSASIVKENGSTSYGKTADELCYTSGNFFYPAKGYRGATARILMYVQTRWGDEYQLKFVDSAGNCKTIGKISTLLKWHLEEPPTASEIYRNQKAYEIQGNRNPFIDHPEYATKIYCNDGNSYNAALKRVVEQVGDPYNNTQPLVSLSFQETTLNLAAGATATLTVVANPTNAKKNLTWTTSNANVATVSNGVVTAVASGTATITATDKDTGLSATATVTVKQATGISIAGTPTKTEYLAGNSFSPAGLTVSITYSDGTTAVVENSQCQWLDGVTKSTKLAEGTQTVICKYGTFEKTISGITVAENPNPDPEPDTVVSIDCTQSPSISITKEGTYTNYEGASATGGIQKTLTGNGITIINDIGTSTSEVTVQYDNSGSVRFYSGSTLTIQYPSMKKIVITTDGSKNFKNDIAISGATVAVDGTTLTITFAEATGSVTFALTSQARVTNVSVTAGSGSGTVTPDPVVTVTLNKTALSLTAGGNETLVATVSTGAAVTWTSSNEAVAKVDANGKVTAIAAGTATITAKVGSVSATCQVTVSAGGTVTPDPVLTDKETYLASVAQNLAVGTDYKLALWQNSLSKVFYAIAEMDGNYLKTTENASDAAILRLENGTYEGCYYLKLGNKYISFDASWGGKYVKANITLTDTPSTEFYVGTHNELISLITAEDGNGVLQTESAYLGTHGTYSTLSATGVYYLQNEADIDVSQYVARLVVVDSGSGTVTPDPVVTVTLNKTALSLTAGGNETLVATVSTGAAVTWTSSNEAVAKVDANGKITAIAAGTATITAKVGSVSATCQVTVSAGTVTPDPTPDEVTEFVNLVTQAQNATGREQKFNAIKEALTKYNTLTDAQKSSAATAYQTLQGEITSYNQAVSNENAQHLQAVQNAVTYASAISVGFVALLAILKRKSF